MSKSFKSKIYKKFDTLVFDSVFNRTMDTLSRRLSNTKSIKAFYAGNAGSPKLIVKFYGNRNLDTLLSFLQNSNQHGLNPEMFSTKELAGLLEELKENKYTNVEQAYPTLAKVELLSADAYISYVNYLRFGVVDPRKVFSRYLIPVKRPDHQSAIGLLNSIDISDTLDHVQNKSRQYKALQSAYLQTEDDAVRRILAVNMERLRWVLPKMGEEYVQVNIPDFNLVYYKQEDTLAMMKVCVGSKSDEDYDKKMEVFKKSGDYEDRPDNHETPMLFGSITLLYANPVWNIPESIAKNEIYPTVLKNRSYLNKNQIGVYYKNKLVQDPGRIRWSKYSREKLPFRFVQKSGPKNSLGKFKFAFQNNSSIYLHDTNFKKAFKLTNRAISHGCIRLERPLKFAELLVADKAKYDKLRSEIGLAPLDSSRLVAYKLNRAKKVQVKNLIPEPVAFSPKKPVSLLITYFTAWEMNNKIEYRPDVYGMDKKLWLAINKVR